MADKKIGGHYYRTGIVLATTGIKLQARLMALAGPAMDKLPLLFAARAAGVPIEEDAKSRGIALAAIGEVFAHANPDAVAKLISDICEMAMVSDDGKTYEEVVFDHHFSGPMVKEIYPVALFVLQETLGDFFTGDLGIGSLASKASG